MLDTKNKKRVGILRGGNTENYKSSLKKGGNIISHISGSLSDRFKAFDILVDKDSVWHLNGIPVVPADLVHKVDVVWNVAEPQMSTTLRDISIPHVSSDSFSFAIANNRDMLRDHAEAIGTEMPRSVVLPAYQSDFDGPRDKYSAKKAKEIFEKFSAPWLVSALSRDTNIAVHVAKTFPQLVDAIEDVVGHGKSVLVEELIKGKVATVHSVSNFRGEDVYVFPLANFHHKFSAVDTKKLTSLSRGLHSHINAKHYLKSVFIVNKRGKVYLLNVELVPDLGEYSHFSQSCESIGAKAHHLTEHILESILK